MKVAITHTRYTARGGVEGYVWDLVKRLLARGHEVHFFCHFWDDDADPRVHLHRIPNRWKPVRFLKVWSYDRWLRRHVRRADWDVVHGFSKSSEQDIYTDGSGCLLDYQAYSIDEAGGGPLARALRRVSLHQREVLAIERARFTRGSFVKVVTMSELAARQIRSRYGLTEQEVVTVYNGIDLERYRPALRAEHGRAVRARLGVDERTFVVLCIGNDYRRKGVPALIEAARLLRARAGDRPVKVVVVGKERPPRLLEMARLAAERGVGGDVVLCGPSPAAWEYLGAADLFVLPSRFDAFGNVVLEALAAGVPCLVSSKAGAAEVVREGETGWVLGDPDDAGTIAERIAALAQDEAVRRRMGEAARASAEAYSWDRHFERMLALYEEVVALKGRGAPPQGAAGSPAPGSPAPGSPTPGSPAPGSPTPGSPTR